MSKNRINERAEDTKKFTCDYEYTCDWCESKSDKELKYKFGLPVNSNMDEGLMFCRPACVQSFFTEKNDSEKMKELRKDIDWVKSIADHSDDYADREWETGLWMSFDDWIEFFKRIQM